MFCPWCQKTLGDRGIGVSWTGLSLMPLASSVTLGFLVFICRMEIIISVLSSSEIIVKSQWNMHMKVFLKWQSTVYNVCRGWCPRLKLNEIQDYDRSQEEGRQGQDYHGASRVARVQNLRRHFLTGVVICLLWVGKTLRVRVLLNLSHPPYSWSWV